MRIPSVVSTSDMPAVNRAGNTKTDQIGRFLAASDADKPSSATSVAVSKPKPNRKPNGYICQLLLISLNNGAKQAGQQTASSQNYIHILLDVSSSTPHPSE